MNLVVDLGNTRVKFALFDQHGDLQFKDVRQRRYAKYLLNYLPSGLPIENAILCNSAEAENEFLDILGHFTNFVHFDHETKIPLVNKYATPITLGKDRLAAAVGAWSKFPRHNILFIDLGTCMTTNIVTANGEYLGGNISPGINMRLKAMHTFTAKLPLVEIGLPIENLGNSTVKALQNGAVKGTFREIDSFIEEIRQDLGDLIVILTGGDAKLFENWTKNMIFAAPNLVLEGLNEILKYNVK